MTFGYKDNFHFRSIRLEDEVNVRNIIFDILREYGLPVREDGVDGDLFNILQQYESGLFGVVESTDTNEIIGSFAVHVVNAKTVELRKMYVLKEHRNKGLGKWILHYCEQWARKRGYRIIELETATVLKEAAILYTKMGYQHKKSANHTPRCDMYMFKEL